MRLTIRHRTIYNYEAPLERGVQLVRLWPGPHAGLSVLLWDVRALGARMGRSYTDGLSNRCALADLDPHATRTEIIVEGEGETRDTAARTIAAAEPLPPDYFLRVSPRTEPNEDIIALSTNLAGSPREKAEALMHAVRDRVSFRVGATDVEGVAADALRKGEGVCQDHAHLFCSAARAIAIPARYVSGYLFTGDARSPAAHAWVEAHDGEGWLGLDPANRTQVSESYVRLAIGLDYRDAAPIVGARAGGGAESLSVEVNVSVQ